MAEFINGVRTTVTMREDTSKTNYEKTYGKMIPGKSYIFLDFKFEVAKDVEFGYIQVNFGVYSSFIDLETIGRDIDENPNYRCINSDTYNIDKKSDGSMIITATSYSLLSNLAQLYNDQYVFVGITTNYSKTTQFDHFPLSNFNMYQYMDPSISFIKADRVSDGGVVITLRMIAFIKNGFTSDDSLVLHIKEQTKSEYTEIKPAKNSTIKYDKNIDYVNGTLYTGYVKITVPSISNNTHNAYITFNTLGKEFQFLIFNIPAKYQLLCFGKNGQAIAFGKICEQDGFENNLESWHYKPAHFVEQVHFNTAPTGIPSDTMIIKGTLEPSKMIEMGFGGIMGNDPQTTKDDHSYPYKQTFWLKPSKYGKTVDDFLNNCVIEMFMDTPCNGICPRLYYRTYAGDIEIDVLSMVRNITTTPIRLRFTFSDVFTY